MTIRSMAIFIGAFLLILGLGIGFGGSLANAQEVGDRITVRRTEKGRYDVEFEKVDVRDALHYLCRQQNVSYTISPEVVGEVTASLKEAPFESVFGSIVRQVNATYRIEGGIYTIEPRSGKEPPARTIKVAGPDPRLISPFVRNAPRMPGDAPIMLQDNVFLYVLQDGTITKVRKDDLTIAATLSLPSMNER